MADDHRHAARIAILRRAILVTPGATSPAERMDAEAQAVTAGPAAGYLLKVRNQSYRIVDDDLRALYAAGLGEDAILELTLATALGAASRPWERGMAALLRAQQEG